MPYFTVWVAGITAVIVQDISFFLFWSQAYTSGNSLSYLGLLSCPLLSYSSLDFCSEEIISEWFGLQWNLSTFVFCIFSNGFYGYGVLFMGPMNTEFNKFYFKIESHGSIHIFKNYFVTVFSVISFQFLVISDIKIYQIQLGQFIQLCLLSLLFSSPSVSVISYFLSFILVVVIPYFSNLNVVIASIKPFVLQS